MKRKVILVGICAMILCTLAACSLAREDAGENPYEDKLIGVFISTEHLDLYDFKRHLNDNLIVFRGGEIITNSDTDKYQGRLYATLMPKTLTNEETGETTEIMEYVFENISGIPYFYPTIKDELGNYSASMSDNAISEGHIDIKQGDDEDSVTMEGTLYVLPGGTSAYFLNPVYHSADGSVYLTSGNGISSSGEHDEGSMMSQSLSAKKTITENGKTKTDSFSVTISVSFMFAPESIIILQMNENGELLSRLEYAPDALPDSFEPEAQTAFLVVETKKHDSEGTIKVSRNIYNRDAQSMETFYPRADGVCVKDWTLIEWTD